MDHINKSLTGDMRSPLPSVPAKEDLTLDLPAPNSVIIPKLVLSPSEESPANNKAKFELAQQRPLPIKPDIAPKPPRLSQQLSLQRPSFVKCQPVSPKPFRRTSLPPEEEKAKKDETEATLNVLNHDIDSLLAEVDQQIRFSLNVEEEGKQKPLSNGVELSQVKNDLSDVRRDLSALKNDLNTGRKPLMDMMNNFGKLVDSSPPPSSPSAVAPRSANELNKSHGPAARRASKEMEEVEKAMTQLAKTIEEFHSPTSSRKVKNEAKLFHLSWNLRCIIRDCRRTPLPRQ